MQKKSLTALISLFAKAYHFENNKVRVFSDTIAKDLISPQEYLMICEQMSSGISFFDPTFKGNKKEALRFIVDKQLSPTPLGRAAFAEKALKTSVLTGTRQYIILAAGYDTFAYRQPAWSKDIEIFEVDQTQTSQDKQSRLLQSQINIPKNTHFINADFIDKNWSASLLSNGHFLKDVKCFCSMLGLTYYLSKDTFENLLDNISPLISKGSELIFDYPTADYKTEQVTRQNKLAKGANEEMLSEYTYDELEKTLEKHGYLIYEHLNSKEITDIFFSEYNKNNIDNQIKAFDNVSFCLAVKQ